MPPKSKPTAKATAKPAAKAPVKKGVATAGKTGAKTTAGKKTNVPAKGKEAPKEQKPAVKKWTAEDDAAKKIQTGVRGFLARRALEKKKKEKEDYEALMEQLEKEALIKVIKMQQEEIERERQKEEEERRQIREQNKRVKRMLEAAFDGDVDEMKQILKEMKELDDKNGVGNDVIGRAIRDKHEMALVECEDAHSNTPLSEASSGGSTEAIQFLLDKGADPNSIGRFKRTPLYRAAFAGHLDAIQLLLQNGADKRLYAEDAQLPENVTSNPAIIETLTQWDVSQTEKLLKKIEADKEKRKEQDRARREAETSNLQSQVEEAEKTYKAAQKKVKKCNEELNKRIFEHDHALSEGFENKQLLVQMIHDAETDLEIAKIDFEKARDQFSSLRLQLRDKQLEGAQEDGEVDELPGLKVTVRELDDVLLRDVGNRIKESGKYPLIIDTTGQACTFLRYRDTNYLNALNPFEMEVEKVRMATLGALRYGKPLVLDMMEVDMFETVTDRFDEVMKGLMDSILDKTIIQEAKYTKLIKDTDPPDYNKNNFNEARLERFSIMVITKNPFPPENLMDRLYAIRIHVPAK